MTAGVRLQRGLSKPSPPGGPAAGRTWFPRVVNGAGVTALSLLAQTFQTCQLMLSHLAWSSQAVWLPASGHSASTGAPL